MNFTKVRKTAFTTELRWTQGQPFACVVSLRHIACIGISAVAHFFNRWASGPAGVGPSPRALCSLGGIRGSGLGEAAARPGELSRRTELFVCVGASRRAYGVVCLRGSPFGAQREVAQNPYYVYYLILSGLLTTWLQYCVTWPIIVNGKNTSGSIDSNWIKSNFTWIIHSFWSIFTRKSYLVFNNTALRSNLIAFPKANANVLTTFFWYQPARAQR